MGAQLRDKAGVPGRDDSDAAAGRQHKRIGSAVFTPHVRVEIADLRGQPPKALLTKDAEKVFDMAEKCARSKMAKNRTEETKKFFRALADSLKKLMHAGSFLCENESEIYLYFKWNRTEKSISFQQAKSPMN